MWRQTVGQALLVGVGAAHLLPATAVASRGRVEHTYDVAVDDPGVELLLRHRAVFFGMTGFGLILAAFLPHHRPAAFAAGGLSLTSYVALAATIDTSNARLERIKSIDVALLAALGAAALLTARGEDS